MRGMIVQTVYFDPIEKMGKVPIRQVPEAKKLGNEENRSSPSSPPPPLNMASNHAQYWRDESTKRNEMGGTGTISFFCKSLL